MLIQLEAVRGDRHVWRKLSNRIAALLTATNARLQASQRQDFCDQSAPVHHTRENIDDDESPEAQSGLLSRPVGRAVMRIEGKCHCSNISYVFHWPGDGGEIPVRACGCDFCTKHGVSWTSHRDSELIAKIADAPLVSKYRFGTGTADFYVCARCGVAPFVTCAIDDQLYAVVNANTFEGIDRASLIRAATNFDGEGTGERLDRRKRSWIPSVNISS